MCGRVTIMGLHIFKSCLRPGASDHLFSLAFEVKTRRDEEKHPSGGFQNLENDLLSTTRAI